MKPLVSILIPCHNAAAWVGATLESALSQTWAHVEVILVDDGSSDTSLAVVRAFTNRGVTVVTQPNSGASAARNHAFSLARGDFIQFLDADDLLATDKIERQIQRLLTGPANRVASGPWGRFDLNPSAAIFQPEENWRDAESVDWLTLNFSGRGMMPPAAWLIPRALADAAGPWDERLTLNDDGEYFCRVLLASSGVSFCADARTYYRSNLAGSLSRRRTDAAWRSAFLSQQLCSQHLLKRQESPHTRRACANLFQRLAFAAYPDSPWVVTQAEAAARSHGGSFEQPGGGIIFQRVARIFGWKFARRIQEGWRSR